MRHLALLAACIIAAAFFSRSALAWGCDGHGLTAAVGLQTLSDDELSWFQPGFQAALQGAFPTYDDGDYPPNAVMSANPEAHLACEPDILRNYPEFDKYKSWHFYDTCYSPTNQCPKEDGGMMRAVLPTIINNLKNAAGKGPMDWNAHALNLTYLLHLVGDAHQPLHTCTMYGPPFTTPEGDVGGNKFYVQAPGANGRYSKTKLHSFYDGIAGVARTLSGDDVDDVAQEWRQAFPPQESKAADLNVDNWLIKEGRVHCKQAHQYQASARAASGELQLQQRLSGWYIKQVQKTLQSQVVLGGVRLGNVLKSIYAARFDRDEL